MPARMDPERLARLHRAASAARAAEEARLARCMSEIAACRARAEALRRAIAGPGAAAGRERGGEGEPPPMQAAELAVAARWRDRLGREARDLTARVEALGAEAAEVRGRLARAFGRERVLADLLGRARREARRAAERRAEDVSPRAGAAQSSSREPESEGGTSAGSPGMA